MLRRLLIVALLLSTACASDEQDPVVTPPPPEPALTVKPRPGTYTELEFEVAVTAPTRDDVLFFDFERDPDVTASRGYFGTFRVRVVKSSRLHVVMRDAAGTLWGPYIYEYRLQPVRREPFCTLDKPGRTFYRPGEPIEVVLNYFISNALNEVFVMVDGKKKAVTIEAGIASSAVPVDIGTLAAEGRHTVGCRIEDGKIAFDGAEHAVFIDGTPPSSQWTSAGGAFNHETWPGSFLADVSDTGSGLARVDVCDAGLTRCMPAGHLAGNTYYFATALTWATQGAADLRLVAVDAVGNAAAPKALAVDLNGFAEPARPAPQAITLTTAPVLDLPGTIGAAVTEVRLEDFSPVPLPYTALPLTAGWNEFLFRVAGETEWRTYAIYRNGVSLALPPTSGNWLIYASNSTVPAYQARSVEPSFFAATAWSRAWFDVPHLWAVEDDGNFRWDGYERVFTVATDAHAGEYLSQLIPVEPALTEWTPASAAGTAAVDLTCAACGAGRLYFERRTAPFGWPVSHVAVAAASFPARVTVAAEAGDTCWWFWDENDDGVAGGQEPRAWHRCGDGAAALGRSDGGFRLDGGFTFRGIPYGATVTWSVTLLSQSSAPLSRRPMPPYVDSAGLGMVGALDFITVPAPGVDLLYSFWAGNQAVTFSYVAEPDFRAFSKTASVTVRDEQAPAGVIDALVVAEDSNGTEMIRAVNGSGVAQVGFNATAEIYAEREGYLSQTTQASASISTTLRLLSTNVTGLVHGTLQDAYGYPISGAELTWVSPGYRARVLSQADGYYALPASGGAGQVSLKVGGRWHRDGGYALSVTRDIHWVDMVLPAAPDDPWPLGLQGGSPLLELAGPATTAVLHDGTYATMTTAAPGTWASRTDYYRRRFVLPGALPTEYPRMATGSLTPYSAAIGAIDTDVVCGDRFQDTNGGALFDVPCWSWIGTDGLQQYYFARINPVVGFPTIFGMQTIYVSATKNGAPAPSQPVVFRDLLFGRTIRGEVTDGFISMALPYGYYRLEDPLGNPGDEFSFSPQGCSRGVVALP